MLPEQEKRQNQVNCALVLSTKVKLEAGSCHTLVVDSVKEVILGKRELLLPGSHPSLTEESTEFLYLVHIAKIIFLHGLERGPLFDRFQQLRTHLVIEELRDLLDLHLQIHRQIFVLEKQDADNGQLFFCQPNRFLLYLPLSVATSAPQVTIGSYISVFHSGKTG